MKKIKLGCITYFIFALLVIFCAGYTFTTIAPKSSQMAKEEVLERFFGKYTKDTVKTDSVIKKDTVYYVNNNVDIITSLKDYYSTEDVEVIYDGPPETSIPTIIDGEISVINLSNNLRAKLIKYKVSGKIYDGYVIFGRISGKVVNIINEDAKKIEKTDTIEKLCINT